MQLRIPKRIERTQNNRDATNDSLHYVPLSLLPRKVHAAFEPTTQKKLFSSMSLHVQDTDINKPIPYITD